MTSTQIILLVVGILAIDLIILILIFGWIKRKSASLIESVRNELMIRGEKTIRGPETAIYRGGTGNSSKIKGNGLIVLTNRSLIFKKIIGQGLEISLEQIKNLRQDKWFLNSYRNGRFHLILQLKNGDEIGFIVQNHSVWLEEITKLIRLNYKI